MLLKIIDFSIKNKLIIILFTLSVVAFGIYSVLNIPVGAVPDITNNQVQVITTSGNLSTQEIEQFITAPVEMEMANLPGVEEIRSISKFGISVVTIVFDEKLGTYLPRQLIAEKLKTAADKIPDAYGDPEMGPITTGLGEIYQYVVDTKPGYEGKYTAMELRTIQDWIIKRRLSGIKGVVEINSWGGLLKQYQVAINPILLQSTNTSLIEVYQALEQNNSVAGAAYIEKSNQSYFIRGDGQVKSIEDIENIVIKNNNGNPVLIRDIGKVEFGSANRFGAITANGKGETVLGQIMMLKDANSKEVIKEVKSRISEIQKNLPEGVFINPIVERSELISKTTFTVVENLVLGAIIVMLTVIFLLGNFRAALVISSMIPLALLFTISMMYIFGIDANLMSLGALDFGIIIDGAVIIVEFILLKISINNQKLSNSDIATKQSLLDQISLEGTSKMIKSAIFGQVIILIVFIPILSLSGVEGKMFRPMAISFSFAIIGAMIFGLTWLPVASSIFLKNTKLNKVTIADKIIKILQNSYLPSIRWSLKHKTIVLSISFIVLIFSAIIFTRIGAEFVPTLDEGDFVIQPVLKTGTSLSKTIELTTQMESILIKEFPNEVDKIVSRIGAAEVPTDPMSMEEIDMIIKLHPKDEWRKAKQKDELAEIFKESLSVIPGIEYEFTQPIEMRFNELITGVRSDIAIKIFGEDLAYIEQKAIEIKELIQNVPGASEIILEKTSGLPQIQVKYNRSSIAKYGMDIETLNTYLTTAFSGSTAGAIFEGEKRFDLVLKFDKESRVDVENIKQLLIPIESGAKLPLSEFADIHYTSGPAKISRDNTHRRIVVAVNIMDRDLQSVISDIQKLIDKKIVIAPGNYIDYGGQFENLQNATKRLVFAVPVALLLIFIFLHFAFKTLKDAIMIFSAIPLAAVGGIILLWVRDMPFSVSAGVGFIALFGIAVLNGIVLIEHLKELQSNGITDLKEMIIKGTYDRLRPVILTAAAAAMGFLPMAISSGAGAEVQRPLATVVIGGLITSTLLTMIVLPILFELFNSKIRFKPSFPIKTLIIIVLSLAFTSNLSAQNKLSLNDLENLAIENNLELQAFKKDIDKSKLLQKSAFSLDKTLITYGTDENNIAENGYPLNVFGITQTFKFPRAYSAEYKARRIETEIAEVQFVLKKNEIIKNVHIEYFNYSFNLTKLSLLNNIDSIYSILVSNSSKQYELGENTNLQTMNLKASKLKLDNQITQVETEISNIKRKITALLNSTTDIEIDNKLELKNELNSNLDSLPIFKLIKLENELNGSKIDVNKNNLFPDFSVNYFLGTNYYDNAKTYQGFEIGVAIPLFFGGGVAELQSEKISYSNKMLINNLRIRNIKNKFQDLLNQRDNLQKWIDNYNEFGMRLYDEIIETSMGSYQLGEINYYELSQNYENAIELKLEYLENIHKYNILTTEINNFIE